MKEYFTLMFGLVFVQNFVLNQFLGLCPFLGVSKRKAAAVGMGAAVVFVMAVSCAATFLFHEWVLVPFGAGQYLDIAGFILLIAALVQFVEIVMKKTSPGLYRALGIYLPLISTNCAVLGSTQLKIADYSSAIALGRMTFLEGFFQNVLIGLFGGIGFALALFLMAGVRERLELAPVPAALKGLPAAFIAAACMAMAFFGFSGMV